MNIYYDSNYASQSSLPSTATFQSITTNNLTIPAANAGDILFADSSHNIDGLAIGPVNYVLQSSGTDPQWTDAITMNTVTTTSLVIPGTSQGDLFTVNGSNTFERVAIGALGSTLVSTGSQFEWISNQYYFTAGALSNIINVSGTIATTNMSFVAGYRYRLQITGKYIEDTTYPSVYLTFNIASTNIDTITFTNSNAILINYIFTAGVTGSYNVTLTGVVVSGFSLAAASLENIYFTLELF